jgi:hypothetical protein
MIEFDNTKNPHLMFFAGDGSWGDASDIVIVDAGEIDGHFTEVVEFVSEYLRADFMRWYVENQTHDQNVGEYENCVICERWQDGTEDEIQQMLEEEDEE